MRIPIHREGWPFIGIAVLINFLLFKLVGPWGWLFAPITVWVIAFFRDPERTPPEGSGQIVCPADGIMLPVVETEPPAELEMGSAKMTRLSIFMNVFNVHVNRMPVSGTVAKLAYRPGKFFNASFDKASVHNERQAVRVVPDESFGGDIAVVQIAGLVARRIVCDLKEGERVWRGNRFGIIRFGSRVDIYLPAGGRVLVNAGQSVKAGETVLAAFPLAVRVTNGRAQLNQRVAELREDVPFGKFLPNACTLIGLCCGATAIRFALSGNWEASVIAIVLAAVFDMLDGRLARLFGADSAFGAQLDSLADLVSFGIAPSVVVYTWTLNEGGGAGWAAVLIFCACCAIRLARFNIESVAHPSAEGEEATDPTPAHPYFTGLPTPAAACLILLPLLLSFQSGLGFFRDPLISGAMIALTSALMVSRVPTLSIKHLKITRQSRVPVMGMIALVLGSAVAWPWATMAACLIVYLVYIPVGAFTLGERKTA